MTPEDALRRARGAARKFARDHRVAFLVDDAEGAATLEVARLLESGRLEFFNVRIYRALQDWMRTIGGDLYGVHTTRATWRSALPSRRIYDSSGRPLQLAAPMRDAMRDADARMDVEALLARLSCRERLVLRLRFLEDRQLCEIGRRVGVSESRVCQIVSRALRRALCPDSGYEHR